MNIKDKIAKFKAYALTSMTSLYNEDALTAQELAVRSADKIRECLEAVNTLAEAVDNISNFIGLTYSDETEELTIAEKVTDIQEQVANSFVHLYNEDAMTALELAGCTAKATNECLKAVNMLCDVVNEVNNHIMLNYDGAAEELTIFNGGDK